MCLHKLGASTLDCWSNNSQKLTHRFVSTGAAINFPTRQSGSSIANHVREERACVCLLASRSSTEKVCCLTQDELSLQQTFFYLFLTFLTANLLAAGALWSDNFLQLQIS